MNLSPSRLTISHGQDGHCLVLDGDLDSQTAPRLDAAVQRSVVDELVIDLTRVGFVDSSGLRVLIAAHASHDEEGRRLVLRSPGPAVLRLFEITGLSEHFHLE
jgi:anti-anti-sigma factor